MNRKRTSLALVRVISLATLVLALSLSAAAQTEKVIHSFNGLSHVDGSGPEGLLVADPAGNLYGTSVLGGDFGSGTVFELSPSGNSWTHTVLYSFTGGADGWAQHLDVG